MAMCLMAEPASLADNIRRYRAIAGMTQRALAAAAGLPVGSIRQIEQGDVTDPRVSTLASIAAAFGITVDQLLPPKPDSPPPSRYTRKQKPKQDGDTSP